MCCYGRGQPRKVSVTVADAEARRKERMSEARRQAAETYKCSREECRDDYYEHQHSCRAREKDKQ